MMETFQLIMAMVVTACIAGCIALFRKKPAVAGMLGVTVIVLGASSFAVWVIAFALTKEGAERLVLILTAILASPAVAYYCFAYGSGSGPMQFLDKSRSSQPQTNALDLT